MNCWRSLVFAILASALLAGCVYVPPYYEDPVTPPPWNYPLEPYPRRYDYYGHRPDPYLHRRKYYYDERDRGNYRPDVASPDQPLSNDDRQQVTPPSKRELPDSPTGPRTDSKDIPVATKGSKPGRVKIPFPPYSELDVTGLLPGSLAKDPTSGKVFRLP